MKNKLRIIIMALSFFAISCSSQNDFDKGRAQLEQQGYTEIEETGHKFFCCAEEDTFSTGFKCKDKNGNTVTGCFCSSVFKGVTIRFD